MKYKIYKNNFKECKEKGVYLIRNLDNGLLKIGKAKNLNRRFKEIKSSFKFCGNIPNLSIESFIEYNNNSELERYLHNTFEHNRIQNEWFDIENYQIVLNTIDSFLEIPIRTEKKIHKRTNIDKYEPIKLEHMNNHELSLDYLHDKDFSYKLHLAIFLHGGYKNGKSYIVRNIYNIRRILGMSINGIKSKLRGYYNELYLDENINTLYIENAKTNNNITITNDIIGKLITLDEFDIRLYILVHGYEYDEIRGLTQKDILEMIGFSNKSHNNFTKLTNSTNKLKELGLLDFKVESDGIKKYIIYY